VETERNCPSWRIPDGLWRRMEPFLPRYRKSRLGGRPRLELRKVMNGIFYILRTGCQWKAAPAEFGSGSSLHRYFQEFARHHLFRKLWKYLLRRYDQLRGIQWKWQSLDGSITKAPLGGEKNREKPYRPRQTGGEAVGVDRRARRPVGRSHRWGQCA
jgi:putative transposase